MVNFCCFKSSRVLSTAIYVCQGTCWIRLNWDNHFCLLLHVLNDIAGLGRKRWNIFYSEKKAPKTITETPTMRIVWRISFLEFILSFILLSLIQKACHSMNSPQGWSLAIINPFLGLFHRNSEHKRCRTHKKNSWHPLTPRHPISRTTTSRTGAWCQKLVWFTCKVLVTGGGGGRPDGNRICCAASPFGRGDAKASQPQLPAWTKWDLCQVSEFRDHSGEIPGSNNVAACQQDSNAKRQVQFFFSYAR